MCSGSGSLGSCLGLKGPGPLATEYEYLLANLRIKSHTSMTKLSRSPRFRLFLGQKKKFACPRPTDRLVRPNCKSFFFSDF